MPAEGQGETRTEAVGVFEDADSLQQAIDELMSSGFDRAELSLLAAEETVEKELGHLYDRVQELEDDPAAPRTAYVSKESIGDAEGGLVGGLVYVGALAATGAVVASGGAMAAAGGAGGLIGAVLARMIEDHHARYLKEQLDRGGLLLWVRTRDGVHEKRAVDIMGRHSAHDVHLHALGGA